MDLDSYVNRMMAENMYQKQYLKSNFQGRLRQMIVGLGAKIEDVFDRDEKAEKKIAGQMQDAKESLDADLAADYEIKKEELLNDVNAMHTMIYKLSRKRFGLGIVRATRQKFLYEFSNENVEQAIEKEHIHPWACVKCAFVFENIE